AGGSVRLGGEDFGAPSVRRAGASGQRVIAALHRSDDGFEPGAGNAVDHGIWPDGPGDSGGLSTDAVPHALHRRGYRTAGLRRQSAWELEWTGNQADTGAGVRQVWPSRLPAGVRGLGGPPAPGAQYRSPPETQYQLPAHPSHADPHRGAAPAAASPLP